MRGGGILAGKLAYIGRASDKTLWPPSVARHQGLPLVETVRHSDDVTIMLRKNPLQPPRPFAASLPSADVAAKDRWGGFVAAEDFDATGIMTGLDPSESRYWWMPELYGPDSPAAVDVGTEPSTQATSRPGSWPAAAA